MDMVLEEEGGRELYQEAGAFVWLFWVERGGQQRKGAERF